MSIVPALPFTLTNGTTADATQVMADLLTTVNAVNSGAAENGANSSITSLSGLTTPLSSAQGGTGSTASLGTAAFLNVGTTASSVVQLDGSAKLPAVDGSQLTNLPAAPVTSVAGRTGVVVLASTDISGLGTAATLNVGTSTNQVVQLNGSAQLPAVSGALLTNLPSSGGSSMTLLATATASASTSLAFTSVLSSAYSQYVMIFDQLALSGGGYILLRTSTNNGSSYDSTSGHYSGTVVNAAFGDTAETFSSPLVTTGAQIVPNNLGGIYNAELRFNGGQTAAQTTFFLQGMTLNDFFRTYSYNPSGGASALNAIQLVPSTGNFSSGSVYLYGIRNA